MVLKPFCMLAVGQANYQVLLNETSKTKPDAPPAAQPTASTH